MRIETYFDVDRTIRPGSAALDFCKFLAEAGLVDSSFLAADSQIREKYKRGEIDYHQMVESVVTIHATVLKGLEEQLLASHYKQFVQEVGGFFHWTEELFALFKAQEIQTALVSAGIFPAIAAIADHLRVNTLFTSQPEVERGKYTGRVLRILHDTDKKALVQVHMEKNKNAVRIGFGDSTGDVSMLQLMDYAFVIEPQQKEMIAIAKNEGWPIVQISENLPKIVEDLLVRIG